MDFSRSFDPAHSGQKIATILGLPFLGFAIAIAAGSPLLDLIGRGVLLLLSGLMFVLGMLIRLPQPRRP